MAPVKKMSPKRLETRRRLVEAAARAMTEKGFSATTLDEIAAYAGLTKGAIYDNFRSKDALFLAVMQEHPGHLPTPETVAGTPRERLLAMAAAVGADSEAQRQQIPLRAEFLLYSLSHPELRPQIEAWLTQGFAAERARVEQTFAPGELAISPEAFVLMMQAMIPGLLYLKSQAPGLVSDALVAEIFEALTPLTAGEGGARSA